MTEKEARYAAVRWLNEFCKLDTTPTAKRDEINEVMLKLSHLFAVDMNSYDDAIKLDYTALKVQEIMAAATDALHAGHFDEDHERACEDSRFHSFFDVIKSKQVSRVSLGLASLHMSK